ncbi:fimbria/pilus periplasmic chaperone [Yersinia enterocolitica]|uniref:fimbria/pilus periplasmic chaperone n=1 Tax=Yersinia enterocolitica TaxID=630 RepID=UPI003ED4337C
MKFMLATLAAVLLLQAGTTPAGVIIGGTRLVYDGGSKESLLSVNNPSKTPYLIQPKIESDTVALRKPLLKYRNKSDENHLLPSWAANDIGSLACHFVGGGLCKCAGRRAL